MSSDSSHTGLILAWGFIAVPMGVACAALAKGQGRAAWLWFLLGTVFTVAALWALLRKDYLEQTHITSNRVNPPNAKQPKAGQVPDPNSRA